MHTERGREGEGRWEERDRGREGREVGTLFCVCVYCVQVGELAKSDALVRVRESYSTALEQSSQQHQQQVLALQQELDTAREHVERQVCVVPSSPSLSLPSSPSLPLPPSLSLPLPSSLPPSFLPPSLSPSFPPIQNQMISQLQEESHELQTSYEGQLAERDREVERLHQALHSRDQVRFQLMFENYTLCNSIIFPLPYSPSFLPSTLFSPSLSLTLD